jgi:hypothetical protein
VAPARSPEYGREVKSMEKIVIRKLDKIETTVFNSAGNS